MEVIAERGYRAATFQAIAARAGIKSTRTISYHFADKDELIAAVLDQVFALIAAFVSGKVGQQADPAAELAAYIRTTVALNEAHAVPMQALTRIFLEHRPADGSSVYGAAQDNRVMTRVEDILARGQHLGVFTGFDPSIMAVTIQRSLDGLPFLLQARPELDLGHYAAELVATFERATGAGTGAATPE